MDKLRDLHEAVGQLETEMKRFNANCEAMNDYQQDQLTIARVFTNWLIPLRKVSNTACFLDLIRDPRKHSSSSR